MSCAINGVSNCALPKIKNECSGAETVNPFTIRGTIEQHSNDPNISVISSKRVKNKVTFTLGNGRKVTAICIDDEMAEKVSQLKTIQIEY